MKKILLILILIISVLFSTKITFAEIASLDDIGGGEANSSAAYVVNQNQQGINTEVKATTIIGGAIKIVLGLGGTVSLIYIVWSGWGWMVAKGDTTKILVIRKRLAAALVGLMLIAGSYAITDFVINQIIVSTGDNPSGGGSFCESYNCSQHSASGGPTVECLSILDPSTNEECCAESGDDCINK